MKHCTTIQVEKTIQVTVGNGELKVFVDEQKDVYVLEYHNKIYKGSPFRLPNNFSTEFTIAEVYKSHEVQKFLNRF